MDNNNNQPLVQPVQQPQIPPVDPQMGQPVQQPVQPTYQAPIQQPVQPTYQAPVQQQNAQDVIQDIIFQKINVNHVQKHYQIVLHAEMIKHVLNVILQLN